MENIPSMETTQDVEMKEEPIQETQIASIEPADITDPNPAPQTQTAPPAQPLVTDNTNTLAPINPAVSSLAAPPRTGSLPLPASAKPEKPVAHGGPTRQYLNHNITPHLLEGMKYLAMYEPEKPLAWLADFLMERSRQVEG